MSPCTVERLWPRRRIRMAEKILVVEDDPQNMYLVTYLLEKSGYEVISAHDGEQAVQVARESHPDLILMDMLLPKLDGYAATKALKSDPETQDIKVVALTAYSMKGDKAKVMEAGCIGYIPKLLDPSTFADEIARYLGEEC